MFIFCFYEIILHLVTVTTTFILFSFYCIIIPLILGFWPELLSSFHLGILWTCLVFSYLPERLYDQDFADGTIEFLCLNRYSHLHFIFFSKLTGYWFLKVCGVLLSYYLLSYFYQFEFSIIICLSLAIGSFLFLLICSFHSFLTVGIQKIKSSPSLHYLATLPTLFPLILLCNYIQIEMTHFFFLIGLAGFYCSIGCIFGSYIIKKAIAS